MIFRILLALALLTGGANAQMNSFFPGPGTAHTASGCSEATVFLARTSGLDATHTTAYTDLICGMVTDGIWAKADALYIEATQDSTTSRLNIKSTSFSPLTTSGGTLLGDPVYTGDNVGTGDLILLKPSDIYRIGDTGVEVAVSSEAMIEQNSVPTGATDTPVAASATMTSMFQEDSSAIRVVRHISFAKRRASAVQYIGDADYGADAT
jgi:hypothetical protein